MHPNPQLRQKSLGETITHRCYLFRQGHIKSLYDAAFATPNHTPQPPVNHTPTNPTDTKISHSAQLAIDQDNLQAATARLFSAHPQAALTTDAIRNITALYPSRRPYQTAPNTRTPTTQRHTNHTQSLKIDADNLQTALRRLRRGTATGPYGDSTDFLRSYALHARRQPEGTFTFPYFDTFRKLVHLVINASMPAAIHPIFTANYLMALHKNIQQPTKLRPIGIGTALRRIVGAIIMQQHRPTLATYFLAQGQFGIGIKGGMDLLLHATTNDVHQLITTPQQREHALLSLDIKNMFNAVSRNATLTTIRNTTTLHPLLPYYRLLYDNPNTCWYLPANSDQHQHFLQHEGHAQGDPLSGAFSAIPLSLLLNQIRPTLLHRQQQRIPSTLDASNQPSLHAPRSYMDDTSVILHHDDIPWFIHQFQQHGPQFGIHLNASKTRLLTATDHRPTAPLHHTHSNPHIHHAIQLLTNPDTIQTPEVTTGIRLLGTPIGSPTYCHQFLHASAVQPIPTTDRPTPQTHPRSPIKQYCVPFMLATFPCTPILH